MGTTDTPAAVRDAHCRICHQLITVPLRTAPIDETCARHAGQMTGVVSVIRSVMRPDEVGHGLEVMATNAAISLLHMLRGEVAALEQRTRGEERMERSALADREVKAIKLARVAGQAAAYVYVLTMIDNVLHDLTPLTGPPSAYRRLEAAQSEEP